MKKLFVIAILFALAASCTKEPVTTYQITNNAEGYEHSDPYLNGTLYEVIVFHYIGEDIAGQQNLDPIAPDGGISKQVEVPDNIEKVKLSFKILPPESENYSSPVVVRKYVVAFKYLTKGEHNDIMVDGGTLVSNYP